jgi:DNA-binding response OmpR family regulator
MDDYVSKPIQAGALFAAIELVLGACDATNSECDRRALA